MSNPSNPVIGSRVLYSEGPDILPAVVTHIFDENCVNLQVFTDDETGLSWKKGVMFGFQDHQWCWPTEPAVTQNSTTPDNPPPVRPDPKP
jgi:hypothetical protein